MATPVSVTPIDEVKRFIINCFEAVGTTHEHAEIVAENLVEADCRGHYSHGLNRLHWYINDINDNILDPNAVPVIERETVATALVQGNSGLGAVIGKYCMDLAIRKAKDVGIGLVTVRGSTHYGIAGIYTLQAIKEGCIGISLTNTSPVMVPSRAKQAAIGTNPLSVGAPGKKGDSFVLDMATTTVALGKLEVYKRKDQPIPWGWAFDDQGIMTTDPKIGIEALKLLPLGGEELNGGYKGYGLGMMVELLSGVLSGANYGSNIPIWNGGQGLSANLGQAFIAINPQVFAPGFQDRLSDFMDNLRQMDPSDPVKPILVPGDPERNHMDQVKLQGGLCYVKDQLDDSNKLAEKLKVSPIKSVQKKIV